MRPAVSTALARFFITIILGLVAGFAFMWQSTRLAVLFFAARWMDRKRIGGLRCQHGCSTERHVRTSFWQLSRLLVSTELSPNFGDGGCGSGGGGYGLTVGRLGDDLDPIVECHTKNEFWQLVLSVETTPTFLCAFKQFEDHCERGPVGQTALRSVPSQGW
jgi:hypothetical protein